MFKQEQRFLNILQFPDIFLLADILFTGFDYDGLVIFFITVSFHLKRDIFLYHNDIINFYRIFRNSKIAHGKLFSL